MGNPQTDTTSATNAFSKPITPDGSILEHRPSPSIPNADEMFLSPRVLDAGAFGRYADMLKSIIAQASSESRTLEDYCSDAEQMIKRTTESEQVLSTRLQAGVRMLRMIDERADRTDQLLDKVRQSLPDAQSLTAKIDAVINDRMKAAETKISAMLADAEQRANDAEQRAERAASRTITESEKLNQVVAEAESHLGSIEERIAQAVLQAGKSINDIDQHSAVNKAVLEQTFEKSLARANAVGASLADRVEEASRLTDERIENLSQSIAPLTDAAEQAMRTLGIDPANPNFDDSPLARVESLVERAETQTAAIDRVFAQLDNLRGQAEFARTEFGKWLIDAADDLDTLEDRKDALVGPIQSAAERIADIGPDLEDKLELASTKLGHLQTEQSTLRETINASSAIAARATDRLENQTGQLQALLDGSLHKLTQRVEQAGVWLGSLITRAEQLGTPLRTSTPSSQTSFDAPSFTAPSPVETAAETVAQLKSTINQPSTQPMPAKKEQVIRIPTARAPIAEPPAFNTPLPPQLPIDAISFEGTNQVIEHNDTE